MIPNELGEFFVDLGLSTKQKLYNDFIPYHILTSDLRCLNDIERNGLLNRLC